MVHKMQAAVVERFGAPLMLREMAIPSPGPGQILVKTEVCGVCHTDLHAASGDWPLKPTPPFVPGHEAIGRVAGIGQGVTTVRKAGDRVGVPWLYSACGHCEYCLTAWETVCAKAEFGGYTRNGGFAEYVIADPNYVARIPGGTGPETGSTAYLRRHHDVQRHQGNTNKTGRLDRNFRRRRPWAPRHSVCQGHGLAGLRGRYR